MLFTLGAFAIIGLPPFAGFWSKLAILTAAADNKMIVLIAVILIVSILEAVYYLRVVNRIYFYDKKEKTEAKKPSINALVAMISLGIIILVIGFYPDLISGYLENAAADLMDKGNYIKEVLTIK